MDEAVKPVRLMVVDDYPLFRAGLAAVLRAYPEFDVVGLAGSLAEVSDVARRALPDIILMDAHMPGGGAQATTALLHEMPQLKVLILTISEQDNDVFAAMDAGARGYILKSAELDELLTAIRTVVAGDVFISTAMAMRLINQLKGSRGRIDDELSSRENEVLQLVAGGSSNKEIAAHLFISETTVKAHLRAILTKLHVKNRAQAAAKAASIAHPQ